MAPFLVFGIVVLFVIVSSLQDENIVEELASKDFLTQEFDLTNETTTHHDRRLQSFNDLVMTSEQLKHVDRFDRTDIYKDLAFTHVYYGGHSSVPYVPIPEPKDIQTVPNEADSSKQKNVCNLECQIRSKHLDELNKQKESLLRLNDHFSTIFPMTPHISPVRIPSSHILDDISHLKESVQRQYRQFSRTFNASYSLFHPQEVASKKLNKIDSYFQRKTTSTSSPSSSPSFSGGASFSPNDLNNLKLLHNNSSRSYSDVIKQVKNSLVSLSEKLPSGKESVVVNKELNIPVGMQSQPAESIHSRPPEYSSYSTNRHSQVPSISDLKNVVKELRNIVTRAK